MDLNIDDTLQQGVAAHTVGNLKDAVRLYRAILQIQPQHPEANHNLGVIAVSVDKADSALPLFRTALSSNPKLEQFWISYIEALVKTDQLDVATDVMGQAKKQNLVGERLRALEGQLVLAKQSARICRASPPQAQIDSLLKYYEHRQFEEAEKLALSMTQEFPTHQLGWKALGILLREKGRLDESLVASQNSAELAPHDSEVHYNLGLTLQDLGRFSEAEAQYERAIDLKPDYAQAHNNLGVTLQNLGRPYEAEANYKKAIESDANFAIAFNNLGNALRELGKIEEAEDIFVRAVELDPVNSGENLSEFLTVRAFPKNTAHPIVKANDAIKGIKFNREVSDVISTKHVVDLLSRSQSSIDKYGLVIQTDQRTVHRSNSVDLNCIRHKDIFRRLNIIPKFCFGCYKLQIEPRTVVELIKLMIVFDQLRLKKNNSRKCLIETRPEVPGFYKGLIYCSSPDEAEEIADYTAIEVRKKIGVALPTTIKRGCAEYSIAYPEYKQIKKNGDEVMQYNQNWDAIERKYDSIHRGARRSVKSPTLPGFSLNDVLICQNWIDYAEGLGDSSVHELGNASILNNSIYKLAQDRLKTHPWQEP